MDKTLFTVLGRSFPSFKIKSPPSVTENPLFNSKNDPEPVVISDRPVTYRVVNSTNLVDHVFLRDDTGSDARRNEDNSVPQPAERTHF